MNINVNLPSEAVKKLQEKAREKGTTLEAYLAGIALQLVSDTNDTADDNSVEDKSPRERLEAWIEWVSGHKPGLTLADDSRESIYAGRGE